MTMLSTDVLSFVGQGLNRPECVVCHRSGLMFVPDWTPPGGVTVITPDGTTTRILATQPEGNIDLPVRPNGIALESGGSFLLAHLGEERGGIYRLWPDGRVQVVTDEIDGHPMPPANFVTCDQSRRIWITISTTRTPRALDYRPDAATGMVALHKDGCTTCVADGLGYTNECVLSEDNSTLWVNETFARRLTAFAVQDNALTNRSTVTTFGAGTFPDGLTLVSDGSLVVTSIVSNRVIQVQPGGAQSIWMEDCDPDHLDVVETAFQSGEMGRPHLDAIRAARLKNISNLAFGGDNLQTANLGCLLGDQIATFHAPVAGHALPHWDCDIAPLQAWLGVQV